VALALEHLSGYAHLKPLYWDYVDQHKELRPENPSRIVLIELFEGLLATSEAFLRNGIKIRKLYVCKNDPKAREAAKFRLEAFSLIFPKLLALDAWAKCFTTLPQDIRKISKEDLSRLEPADVIVAGFPCQGFFQASSLPLGLRDARSRLSLQAVDIVHMAFQLWEPVGYIFENVDASDHRIPAVRDEFNRVVKGLLGRPCRFNAIADGSYAHQNRYWWTNLILAPLLHTMVERAFPRRDPCCMAQECLDPGRSVGRAHNSFAPGHHSVNIAGQPLQVFSTFVTLQGSHAYRPGFQSMVFTPEGRRNPMCPNANVLWALWRTLPQSFPTTRGRLLGASMDLHAISFVICSAMTFQHAFWHN
jgi:hypothetical protein